MENENIICVTFLLSKYSWYFYHWISATKSTSFPHNFHIFRTQHSHRKNTTFTSQDHNFHILFFLKASILATSLDHNACFNTIYPVQCLQSVTVVVSGCGSCDPKMWMLCSKDVKVVGKRCAFCCRNCCRQKIKTFSVIRIWASYLESLKVTYIKFSFSTKDSL